MPQSRKHRTIVEEILRLAFAVLGAALLLILTVVAVRAAWNMYGKLSDASGGSAASQRELASLKAQEASARASIERLSSERGVEAELRERYGYAKPGEGVVELVDKKAAASSTDAGSENFFVHIFSTLVPW